MAKCLDGEGSRDTDAGSCFLANLLKVFKIFIGLKEIEKKLNNL